MPLAYEMPILSNDIHSAVRLKERKIVLLTGAKGIASS